MHQAKHRLCGKPCRLSWECRWTTRLVCQVDLESRVALAVLVARVALVAPEDHRPIRRILMGQVGSLAAADDDLLVEAVEDRLVAVSYTHLTLPTNREV